MSFLFIFCVVLNKDIFDIIELGADSMYLENEDGVYGFKRLH